MSKPEFNINKLSRRKFLEFLGIGTIGLSINTNSLFANPTKKTFYTGISPSSLDKVVLADGLKYNVLIKWGDPISNKDFFGTHNDYLAFIPINNQEGLLWVNHESFTQKFVTGFNVLKSFIF